MNVKRARHGNNQLSQIFVRVSAALGAARNVVQVIHPLDFERHVSPALDESQVPPRIIDARQVDHLAIFNHDDA
jgi:RAB protein geranylgeranyltransferase component A